MEQGEGLGRDKRVQSEARKSVRWEERGMRRQVNRMGTDGLPRKANRPWSGP